MASCFVAANLESVFLEVSSVHCQVATKLIRASESLWAVGPGADMGLLSGVCAHVRFEVVRSGELSFADFALEGANAGVLSAVSPELVRSGESLPTPLMVADVWFLPGMLPDVHLEMGQLQISLCAAWVEAHEGLSLFLGFHVLLLTNQISGLPNLWYDEGWVAGHGHLEW